MPDKKNKKEKPHRKSKKKEKDKKKKQRRYVSSDSSSSSSSSSPDHSRSRKKNKDRKKKDKSQSKEKPKSSNPYCNLPIQNTIIPLAALPPDKFPPAPTPTTTTSKIKEINIFKLLPKLPEGIVTFARTLYSTQYINQSFHNNMLRRMCYTLQKKARDEGFKKNAAVMVKCIGQIERMIKQKELNQADSAQFQTQQNRYSLLQKLYQQKITQLNANSANYNCKDNKGKHKQEDIIQQECKPIQKMQNECEKNCQELKVQEKIKKQNNEQMKVEQSISQVLIGSLQSEQMPIQNESLPPSGSN